MALSKYRTFSERLQSLNLWPCQLIISISEVARSGFCYHPFEDDENDLLRCAFCKCTLANWKRDTDPWLEHATAMPFCVHLMACKGIEYIFHVLQKEEVIGGSTTTDSFSRTFRTSMMKNLFAYGVKRITDYKQQSSVTSEYNPVSTYTTYGGVKFTMPVHLDMTEFTSRRDSLNRIPDIHRRNLKLDEMAEAGLYFQVSGCIRCYYCDFEFQNWHQHRDPWLLHVSQNHYCMHFIFMKGDDFIQLKLRESSYELRKTQLNLRQSWKRKSGPDNEESDPAHVEKILKVLKLNGDDEIKTKKFSRYKGYGGKRRQRCACCLQRRRETKIRQGSNQRISNNCLQRFVAQGNCLGPHVCFKCQSADSVDNNMCVSLCCNIIVCNCCATDAVCPKCQRSYGSDVEMTVN